MSNNLVFMKGTGGKLDYLVVHKKGNVLLGLKPVVHPYKLPTPLGTVPVTFVGLRMRAVIDDTLSDSMADVTMVIQPTALVTMFKEFELSGKPQGHASNEIGICTNPFWESKEAFLDFLENKDVLDGLYKQFMQRMGSLDMVVTHEEVFAYIKSVYEGVVDTPEELDKSPHEVFILTKAGSNTPPSLPSGGSDNNVLDFQAAQLKKLQKPDKLN